MTSRQWDCMVNGSQHGPVGEELLRQWIAEGRVGRTDLVWSEPMGQWAPAVTALPEAFANAPPMVLSYQATFSGLPHNIHGTGGQTPNGDINARARQLLQSRWGLPIGFCVLWGLLYMGLVVLGQIPCVGAVAILILIGPLIAGGHLFFLTLTRGGTPELGMLFGGFRYFGRTLATFLLQMLIAMVWFAPLVVLQFVWIFSAHNSRTGPDPAIGIVLGVMGLACYVGYIITWLAYSQSLYLVLDEPLSGPWAAMCRSRELMRGHKGKLFCLGLRYAGWSLVCLATLGIGYLLVMPYMATGLAVFYNDLHAPGAAGIPVVLPAVTAEESARSSMDVHL